MFSFSFKFSVKKFSNQTYSCQILYGHYERVRKKLSGHAYQTVVEVYTIKYEIAQNLSNTGIPAPRKYDQGNKKMFWFYNLFVRWPGPPRWLVCGTQFVTAYQAIKPGPILESSNFPQISAALKFNCRQTYWSQGEILIIRWICLFIRPNLQKTLNVDFCPGNFSENISWISPSGGADLQKPWISTA